MAARGEGNVREKVGGLEVDLGLLSGLVKEGGLAPGSVAFVAGEVFLLSTSALALLILAGS